MGFFSRLFSSGKKDEKGVGEKGSIPAPSKVEEAPNDYVRLGLDRPMTEEETELVSVITSAIVAGGNPDSQFRVKRVTAIDENKIAAVLAVSGLLTGDTGAEGSNFVLRSIKEVTN